MRLQLILLTGLFLATSLVSGCPATERSDQLALYEVPASQQREVFLSLSAEEQIEVLLASFKRKQAWDMRLLDWLATSRGDVVTAIRDRLAHESDDWHLETLALVVERLSASHVCRISGDEAHALLIGIVQRIDSPPARDTVERILKRHEKEICRPDT